MSLFERLRRQIGWQVGVSLTMMIGYAAVDGGRVWSAAAGGLTALVLSGWLGWCEWRVNRLQASAQQSLQQINRCAVERFLWALLLFGISFGLLQLAAAPLLLTFALCQIPIFLWLK